MDDLITQGKVHYVAVSNHTAAQVGAVATALEKVGKDASRRIVAAQNRYSLLERSQVAVEEGGKEEAFLHKCERMGVGVIPFFPLASGMLTGRYRKDNLDSASGRIIDDGAQDTFLTERNLSAVEGLLAVAEEKGVTLAQLAIAWLLSRPQVPSVIAGVTKIEHLEDNAGAAQTELTEEDLTRIDRVLEAAENDE